MKPATLPAAARAAALVLAVLALVAGFNTVIIAVHTMNRAGPRTALVVTVVVSAAVTAALGSAAWRLWRRGSRET